MVSIQLQYQHKPEQSPLLKIDNYASLEMTLFTNKHLSDITWVPRCLKSTAPRLFGQQTTKTGFLRLNVYVPWRQHDRIAYALSWRYPAVLKHRIPGWYFLKFTQECTAITHCSFTERIANCSVMKWIEAKHSGRHFSDEQLQIHFLICNLLHLDSNSTIFHGV